MRRAACLLVAAAGSCVLASCFLVGTAEAIPAFQTQFYKKYLDGNENAEYVNAVKKEAKCWLCHQGKNRKHHNAYGIHLTDLLTKKDIKEVEKIVKALDTVAALRSNPDDENSKTYGEMIAAGELPGGSVEECKEEPAEGEGEGK
ncbi:MAG: hypothetical protein WD851_24825 [Pirellulales bacterium]